jgi:hypothetical protein
LLAGEVNALLGPPSSVIYVALKTFDTLD